MRRICVRHGVNSTESEQQHRQAESRREEPTCENICTDPTAPVSGRLTWAGHSHVKAHARQSARQLLEAADLNYQLL